MGASIEVLRLWVQEESVASWDPSVHDTQLLYTLLHPVREIRSLVICREVERSAKSVQKTRIESTLCFSECSSSSSDFSLSRLQMLILR